VFSLEEHKIRRKMYKKTELDEWAKKSIPILQKHGYLETQVIEARPNNWLLPAVFFVLGVALCCIFIYAINHDAFKSEFNQQIEPNVSVNTENKYDFKPTIENQYDFIDNRTVINNIIIPDNLCGGSDE
jgi:hypothetical protein